MVALNFRADQHEPSAGTPPVIEPGWYPVIITKSLMKQVKEKPQNVYLELTMHCAPLARDLVTRFNLINDNPEAVRIANSNFSLLCHVLGFTGEIPDSDVLHNRPFQVYALKKESDDGKGGKRMQNEFTDFKYSNGAEFVKNPGNAPHGSPAGQNTGAPPGYGTAPPAGQPPAAPPPGYGAPQGQPPGQPPAQPWGGAPGQPPGYPPQGQPPAAPQYQPQPGQPPAYAPQPGQPPAYAPPAGQPPAYQPQPAMPQAPPPPGYTPQPAAPGYGAPPPGGPPAWGGPQA